jgi:DNA-binding transcriptional LysR family regulator
MDTRFLDTFVTVVDCGSFAEAARRLHLTPAGLAQRIRTLETEIGAPLFTRSGRTVKPTAAGAAILVPARNFLGELRDLKSVATGGSLSGELRLGAVQTALSGLVPDILKLMASAYPQIEIYIIGDSSAALHRKVINGDIDAAVTSEPPFTIPKTCGWEVLREEPFVVLTPAAMPGRDPHAILVREPFIRLDRSVYAGQRIDAYLRKAGIHPKELFELDGLEAIAVMVDRGLGVTLLPDWAPPWPEGLSLRKLALPDRTFVRRTGLLWNRASLRSRLILAFLEQARLALAPAKPSLRRRRRAGS